MNLFQLFTLIANAIRDKEQSIGKIRAEDFPERIENLQTGIDTLDATATADDIFLNKTAYAQGKKIIGTFDYDTCTNLADTIIYGIHGPTSYTELEYIQNTDKQYINTGINGNADSLRFVGKIYAPSSSRGTDGFIFSNYNGYYGLGDLYPDTSSNRWTFFRNVGQTNTGIIFNVNTVYDFDFTVSKTNWSLTVNGRTASGNLSSYTAPSTNINLFKRGNDSAYSFKGRIYNMKIYKNTELVRDYIPVKRKDNNEVCLYDKVSKQYFVNLGSGSFTAGPEKGE